MMCIHSINWPRDHNYVGNYHGKEFRKRFMGAFHRQKVYLA